MATRPLSFNHEEISINVARLKKGGETFEVVIHPEAALDFRQGLKSNIEDALVNKMVFKDARRGEHASPVHMKQIFATEDVLAVAAYIIKDGEIQLNEEQRKKMREDKRKKVLHLIHVNGVDPKTHLPHPMTRIENAFEEAKIKIDEHKAAEAQVEDVLKKLRVVLPIKFEVKEVQIKLSAKHASRCQQVLASYGTVKQKEWHTDGSYRVVLEIPAGISTEFFDKLNSLTQGVADIKILKEH